MQRQIVKNSENAQPCKMRNQCLSGRERMRDHLEHVVSLFAIRRDKREPNAVGVSPGSKLMRVCFPNLSSLGVDVITMFELCAEERSQQVRRQIARPHIYPRIFVHLTAEKSASVGSFFPKNFCAFVKLFIIDQQCAPFSAREIFGLVEA